MWPDWRDAASVLLLVAVSWHLSAQDGGRTVTVIAPVLVIAAVVLVACWGALVASSRTVRLLALGWALSPVLAFAFASVRAGAPRPVAVAALAVPVWLATQRVWARPWGPALLGGLVAATALRSTYLTALAWFGGGGASADAWLALSWHNQAAALTGTFGVVGVAVAAMSRGWPRIVGGLIAALGLTGAWLSGSRGGVAATVLALGVVLVATGRRRGWANALAATAVAVGCAVVLALALTGEAGQPLVQRDQSAAGNLQARFGHWEAALRATGEAPLTGHGPGSYRWASAPVYPDDVNLTSSAHNEYLEVLSDRGVLGAAPVWLAALGVAGLAVGLLGRPGPRVDGEGPRASGEVAGLAAVVLLGLHAGMDFDWQYPLLLCLLVMAAAVLHGQRHPVRRSVPGSPQPTATVSASATGRLEGRAAATAAIALVVVAGTLVTPQVLGVAEPWQLDERLAEAVRASAQGSDAAATDALAAARAWNPGASRLEVVEAVVAHRAGRLRAAELIGPLDAQAAHRDRLLVIDELLDAGQLSLAERELDELRGILAGRTAWGVGANAERAAQLRLRLLRARDGCAAAQRAWAAEADWITALGGAPAAAAERFTDVAGDCPIDASIRVSEPAGH